MMPSCSWSRSAYCVSTLCIRSSIEPTAIRYRRIIAYIYCSSYLTKPPTVELTPSVRVTTGRRFSYRCASLSSPLLSDLPFVDLFRSLPFGSLHLDQLLILWLLPGRVPTESLRRNVGVRHERA